MADEAQLRYNLAQLDRLRGEGKLSDAQFDVARKVLLDRAGLTEPPGAPTSVPTPAPSPPLLPEPPTEPPTPIPPPAAELPVWETATWDEPPASPPPPTPAPNWPPVDLADSDPADSAPSVVDPPTTSTDWRPVGLLETALTVLLVIGFVAIGFVLLRNLTAPTVAAESVDPKSLVPRDILAGFAVGGPTGGVDDGPLTDDEFIELAQVAEKDRAVARAGFVRGHKQTWGRPDGAVGLWVVIVHPDPETAVAYAVGAGERLESIAKVDKVSGEPDSTFAYGGNGGLKVADALIARGVVSVEVVLLGETITEVEGRGAAAIAADRLRALPKASCISNGDCRERQLALVFLAAMPLGALALGLEAARRRRLGLGEPIAVPGVVGVVSRASIKGRRKDRQADVVLFGDAMVLTRSGWAGAEMIIGLVFAGFLGAYAGQRAMARRDADRRNEVARTPQDQLADAHPSNRTIPYESIERVEVLAAGKAGRARMLLRDGSKLSLVWPSVYNGRNRVVDVLTEVFGDRISVKKQRFRIGRILAITGIVLLGLLLGGGLLFSA